MKCHICSTQVEFGDIPGPVMDATHICNELHKPVCTQHAKGCDEDGHGAYLIDCRHERVNEHGICRTCGVDRRWAL